MSFRLAAFLFALFFIASVPATSQSLKHPSTIGIHYILNDFSNKSLFGNFSRMDASLGLSYLKGINKRLDYTIHLTGSFPDSTSGHGATDNQKHLLLQSDFALRTRPFITRSSNKQPALQPFAVGGIGISWYGVDLGSYLLIGPGLEWNYKDIFLTGSVQYRPSLTSTLNTHYFYSIGIAGTIGKPKKQSSKPVQNIPVKTGARDSDGDGILDSADKCPFVPGLYKFQGCPDTDGDGIQDSQDSCRTIAGLERYHGCPIPDRDKDGINDEEDSCVNMPGVARYHGCPVPDTDHDGIDDEHDSCVTVPGPVINHGCPVDTTIKNKIDHLAKKIFFSTGKYEILPGSFTALNEVVNILKTNGTLYLSIEGHTDNKGTEAPNQVLSANRANAVLEYLVSHGIERSRLKATGYGQSKPLAPNTTDKGRQQNRRVELIIL